MGRIARVVAAKYPHHVTRRGNRRQDTFFCEADELLIHRHEQTGRPLGNIHFIKRLERKLGGCQFQEKAEGRGRTITSMLSVRSNNCLSNGLQFRAGNCPIHPGSSRERRPGNKGS